MAKWLTFIQPLPFSGGDRMVRMVESDMSLLLLSASTKPPLPYLLPRAPSRHPCPPSWHTDTCTHTTPMDARSSPATSSHAHRQSAPTQVAQESPHISPPARQMPAVTPEDTLPPHTSTHGLHVRPLSRSLALHCASSPTPGPSPAYPHSSPKCLTWPQNAYPGPGVRLAPCTIPTTPAAYCPTHTYARPHDRQVLDT